MRELSLDDLPNHSPWPARLLDGGNGETDEQEAEYGGTGVSDYDEVYANLLGLVEANPETEFRELQRSANHYAEESPVAISRAGDLFLVDVDEKQELQDEALVASLAGALDGGETVVSLGCGWGYELGVLAEAYPNCEFVGGDPAENGVALGRELFGDRDRIRVEPFDFRDDEWDLLEDVLAERDADDVVLFTQGSLTALPSVRDVVRETLTKYADRVREGVHLEHVYELHSEESLLGLLRRAYTERRNYNDDLLASLQVAEGVEVTSATYDVVGGNPLHPLSEIRWESA
ncbi:class I SAM-dependent methyltransferase [Halorussus gelatinilyticus]|uniref:Class I SAM-dependent methyltransferase n=1 Tax=Halorussus gelatinilyticus TaxID=2937524 RepID=A0A8U0IJB8_9EURY|nr:class I SAM-dependent methyltransferase [Halorussus gelatinilyticus]UPW00775.1 class I SAM-dependent methyltransferase [Halorussus gelatinilyticus]